MFRNVLGVLTGLVVWIPAFFILGWVLLLVWPAYGAAADTWGSSGRYELTPAMSAFNVLFWILAEILAGWLAVVIAKRGGVAYVLAAVMLAVMSFNHLYYYWDRLPWWYNVGLVVCVVPAVLLGGRFASGTVRR